MLVIRREQMSVLNRKFEAKFRQAVADYLISDYPAYVRELGTARIDNLIDQGIRKAAGLGLEYEAQICDLIAIMAMSWRGFSMRSVGLRYSERPV